MKVSIFGYGNMGRRRARGVIRSGHIIASVCDDRKLVPSGMLDRVPQLHAEKAMSACDSCIICTPPGHHMGYILMAIAARRPFLVEKPFAPEKYTGKLKEKLAGAPDLIAVTGFNLRFHPAVLRAKIKLGSRPVIAATLVLSQAAMEGTNVAEWASHEVDLAMHFSGHSGKKQMTGFALHNRSWLWHMAIDHGYGARSLIHVDTLGRPEVRRFFLLADGGLTIDASLLDPPVSEDDYDAETACFLRSVEDGKLEPPLASAADGMAVAEITW